MASGAEFQLTPERFAQGMTFEEYLAFIGTEENLRREGSGGAPRRDMTGLLRERSARARLTDAQTAAIKSLAERPDGPARMLVIAEEWSSDCRRDLPVLQRLAEAGGMEARIFTRDAQRYGAGPAPESDNPNADLVDAFLRRRGGESFQSIPVVAFYTRDFEHLYTYLEWPAVYNKDRIRPFLTAPRAGESPEQAKQRGDAEFLALQGSPMFDVWAEAAVAEMISKLYERLTIGSLA
jgi:thiol-disulfide isomerase/thioredoxin